MKKTVGLIGLILVLGFLCFIPLALAHAPLGTGENEKISTATVIPDPAKSWALYAASNADGDPQYYTFNVTAGQRIHVMLLKSKRSAEDQFLPMFVVLGPEIPKQGVYCFAPKGVRAERLRLRELSTENPSKTVSDRDCEEKRVFKGLYGIANPYNTSRVDLTVVTSEPAEILAETILTKL